MYNNKADLRKIFKQQRSKLSEAETVKQSLLICQNIIKNFFVNFELSQKIIALYKSINNEVDLHNLETYLLKNNSRISLSKIITNNSPLEFILLNKNSSLKKNVNYQVLEPEFGDSIIPDIVFVPLVAFDSSLARIGMGKGFFDRTIELLRKKNPKILFVGAAYDFQYSQSSITTDIHDEKLDFVITQSQIFRKKQTIK